MTALPIVIRELRVAARRNSTYWTRISVALTTIVIGGYGLSVIVPGTNRGGYELFAIFSWLSALYCAFVGLANCVDCISQEKRDGTLGLLFLTDLKGYDVVFGKLAASGLHSFYGLMAAFPVFAIPLMLGGVTGTQLWQTMLALLNILFISHTLGILTSTLLKNARTSHGVAMAGLGFLMLGIPGLVSLLDYLNISGFSWLNVFDPGIPFIMAQSAASSPGKFGFWIVLTCSHSLGWIFLLIASLRAPNCWQEKATTTRLLWRERLDKLMRGSGDSRIHFRRDLLSINPFLWLVSRNRLEAYRLWILLGVGACFWTWLYIQYWTSARPNDWQIPVFIATVGITHTIFKFFIASEAARHLEEHRRSGSLEFLLSCTPMKPEDIIQGQIMALKRQFLKPGITILVLDALMIAVLCMTMHSDRGLAEPIISMVTAMFFLVADAIAISYVAMWKGLSMNKPRRAAGTAIFRILFVPWIVFMFSARVVASSGFGGALVSWVLIALVVDVVFTATAQENLRTRFRDFVVPAPESLGFFGRLGQSIGITGAKALNALGQGR